MHLLPPRRVPPCPAASVGSSVMSRRPPTGVPPHHDGRGGRREIQAGPGPAPSTARPPASDSVGSSQQPDEFGRRRRRPAHGTCKANAEWVLGPRAAPGRSRSTPCARRTRSHCGARPGFLVCRSTVGGPLFRVTPACRVFGLEARGGPPPEGGVRGSAVSWQVDTATSARRGSFGGARGGRRRTPPALGAGMRGVPFERRRRPAPTRSGPRQRSSRRCWPERSGEQAHRRPIGSGGCMNLLRWLSGCGPPCTEEASNVLPQVPLARRPPCR
jgi:hypothetical protein